MQVALTLLAAYVSTKIKMKWPVVFFLTLPPIAGASALYTLGREPELKNKLLGCYYVVSLPFGLCYVILTGFEAVLLHRFAYVTCLTEMVSFLMIRVIQNRCFTLGLRRTRLDIQRRR